MQDEADRILQDLYYQVTHKLMPKPEWDRQSAWHKCLKVHFYNLLRYTQKRKCDAALQRYRDLVTNPVTIEDRFGTCKAP